MRRSELSAEFGLTLREQAHVLSALCYVCVDSGIIECCPRRWLADLELCPVTGLECFCKVYCADAEDKWHRHLTHRRKKRALEREKQAERIKHERMQGG